MIFDFERCIYEPKTWNFQAYYDGGHETKEKFLEEMKNQNGENWKPTFNILKRHTCNQYAILNLFFADEKIKIYFFDEDIEKMIIAIRASHKRGDNYVFANIEHFEEEENHLNFYADVNTWEQNIYN